MDERRQDTAERITEPSSDLRRSSDYRSSYSTQDGKDRDLERNIGRELSRFRDGRTDSREERRRSPESRRRDGPDPFGRDRDYCRERERGRDVGRSRDSDCGKDRNGRDRDRERHRSRDSDRYERDREDRHKDRYNRNSDDEFDRERDFRRSRDRDYDKDRDRERGHERDRDWDYENKDHAGYSKEWNRPRSDTDDHHHDEHDRSDRDRDLEDREYSRSRHHRRDRDGDDRKWMDSQQDEPTSVVILHGLDKDFKEEDMIEALQRDGTEFLDIRIVRHRSGDSRGFGFLEFKSVFEAREWKERHRGRYYVRGHTVCIDYSRPRTAANAVIEKDWICSKCGGQNFSSKRRLSCFKCGAPKDVSDLIDDKDLLTNNPCKVLILKGLDTITHDETIRKALVEITALPIYDVRLIRDKLTSTSRGFCFVELGSIEEASQLLEIISNMQPHFTIDDRIVTASYAKHDNPPKQNSATVAAAAIEQAQWSQMPSSSQTQQSSSAAANAVAQAQAAGTMGTVTAESYAAQAQAYDAVSSATYQQQYQQQVSTQGTTAETTTVQSQAGNAQYQVTQSHQNAAQQQQQQQTGPQSLSNYVYDPSTGYYYDSTTGLYYDANTQYYFNSATRQFLYWSAETQQYIPVAADGSVAQSGTTSTDNLSNSDVNTKEKQKKAKSLQAKKIAKDMERWAKSVNAAKIQHDDTKKSAGATSKTEETKPAAAATAESDVFKVPLGVPPKPSSLSSLNIVKSIAAGMVSEISENVAASSPLAALTMTTERKKQESPMGGIVAEYGEDDSDTEEEHINDRFTDLSIMACLLCKRQFPNREALERHQKLSDLHKQNLEIHKKMGMTDEELEAYERLERENKYRDRAKERREKYGQPEAQKIKLPPKRRGGPAGTYEQAPPAERIGASNIGNQMLKAMGWTEGSGLGKAGQGIVDPIEAKMRSQNAGLGLKGSNFGASSSDSYKDKLKKLARSRFNDV